MGGPVEELTVYNGRAQPITVSLTVSRLPDETTVINESFTLASEEQREYARPFTEDGRKHLTITVDDERQESFEWKASATPNSTGVSVVVSEEELSINMVSA